MSPQETLDVLLQNRAAFIPECHVMKMKRGSGSQTEVEVLEVDDIPEERTSKRAKIVANTKVSGTLELSLRK